MRDGIGREALVLILVCLAHEPPHPGEGKEVPMPFRYNLLPQLSEITSFHPNSGRGAVRERTCFGSRGSPVRIWAPRLDVLKSGNCRVCYIGCFLGVLDVAMSPLCHQQGAEYWSASAHIAATETPFPEKIWWRCTSGVVLLSKLRFCGVLSLIHI